MIYTIESFHSEVCDLIKKVGSFIRTEANNFDIGKVEVKSFNQLVSYVDKTAENMLVNGLTSVIPESGFITEEKTINKTGEIYNWIIDPLDGTTNFIHGLPVYSISVALVENNRTVAGYIYDINNDWLFHGFLGGHAMKNDETISVSNTENFKDSIMATGFPYYDFKQLPEYIEVLKLLMKETHGLRRMGSAAIDLAYTACGKFDGFFEYGLEPWDVAAGSFLVELAGGKVTDFKGESNYLFGKNIIAGSPLVFDKLYHVIATHFKNTND